MNNYLLLNLRVSALHWIGVDPSVKWTILPDSPALLLCHYHHTVLYFVFYQVKKLTEDSPLPVTVSRMHPSFPIQNECILHNEYQQQISNITGLHNIQIRKTLKLHNFKLTFWVYITGCWNDFKTSSHFQLSNPSGGEIFHTLPDQPGAHPATCTMGTGSFPGVKGPGRGVDHPPPSSANVKERVELYLYSPSGSSWPVLGWTLPFYISSLT
jgi:hypothetical protein